MDLKHPILQTLPQTHPAIVTADVTAVGVSAAAFMGYLPSIAALFSIVWLAIQIATSIDTWLTRKKYFKGPRGYTGENA